MSEVRGSVFVTVAVGADESRSLEWNPETTEEIVQPKGERNPVNLDEPDE